MLKLLLTYLPSGSAEHRSKARGFGGGVFEGVARVPAASRALREAQGTRVAGAVAGVAFLCLLSLAKQRK